MKAKITKRTVDALLPGGSTADTEIKGFVARRLESGTVTYGFRYRNRAGQQRWCKRRSKNPSVKQPSWSVAPE